MGNCQLDLLPSVPLVFLGPLASSPQSWPVRITVQSGTLFFLQAIAKSPASGAWDTSVTEILHVR